MFLKLGSPCHPSHFRIDISVIQSKPRDRALLILKGELRRCFTLR